MGHARAGYGCIVATRYTRAGVGRCRLYALFHGLVTGDGRNRKEGVIVACRAARFQGGQVATGATAGATAGGINRVACVGGHVFIGLKAELGALVALEAESVVLGRGDKHASTVHVVATGAGSHIQLGMATFGELVHRILVALATEFGEVLVSEAGGGFGADGHGTLIVNVVTVGAGGCVAREVGTGQKSLNRVASGAAGLGVALYAGFMSYFKGQVAGIIDEETKTSTLTHMGQTGAMTRFAGDGLVGAAQKLAVIGGTTSIVASQAGGGAHLARPQGGLVATVHAHGQDGNYEEARGFEGYPHDAGESRGFHVKAGSVHSTWPLGSLLDLSRLLPPVMNISNLEIVEQAPVLPEMPNAFMSIEATILPNRLGLPPHQAIPHYHAARGVSMRPDGVVVFGGYEHY